MANYGGKFAIYFVLLALSMGCEHLQTSSSTSNDNMVYGPISAVVGSPNFTPVAATIRQNCATCHEHTAWASYSEQDFINNSYVVPGNLASSQLWTKLEVNGGDMPQSGSLSSIQVTQIQTWIVGLVNNPTSGSGINTPLSRAQAAATVLSNQCISCHSALQTGTLGTVPIYSGAVQSFQTSSDVLSFNQFFIQNGLVIENNPTQSWLYEALQTYGTIGTMPHNEAPLSTADAQSLYEWINQMGD